MERDPLNQQLIDLYLERFRYPESKLAGILQRADIWQTDNNGIEAVVVVTLPATSDYLSYKVAIRQVFEYIDYLESWLDLEKQDITYARKTINDTEIITISFTK